jgi:hypothetical protein
VCGWYWITHQLNKPNLTDILIFIRVYPKTLMVFRIFGHKPTGMRKQFALLCVAIPERKVMEMRFEFDVLGCGKFSNPNLGGMK